MASMDGRRLRRALVAAVGLAGVPLIARAQAEPATAAVEPVTVIGATPLPGTKVDVAKAPYDVRSLSAADLEFGQIPNAAEAMSRRMAGVSVNDNLDDPFQPDLLYRGFTASPSLGTPQGLAVFQNGVRINEAFGDTVNWDLVPSDAIARIDVVGTNPVYGLNALGGAVVVGMKNGFDNPGGELELSGGSFGRRSLALTYGAHSEHLAAFIAARGLDQDGWRVMSSDRLRQIYAELSARSERLRLDLSYTGADNTLHGESPAPVQELAVSRRLIFTSPQENANKLNFVALNGTYWASPDLSFQSNAYVRDFRQSVANGNTTGYVACADRADAGRLCQTDAATPLVSTAGLSIPDLSAGGTLPIGQNDRESLHALSYGGALQATSTAELMGHGNQLSFGLAADHARIDYGAETEVGLIDSALVVQPSGFVVSTPEGTDFTATPVGLRAENAYFGAFITDTLDLTPKVSLTASGRFNRVQIALHDQRGESLSGTNTYSRFNPALGATYQLGGGLTAYAGYAEGSRAPTASEIECSDPEAPCLLPSSLSADPPNLRQVVSRTYEAGLRGSRPLGAGRLSFTVGLYRTEVRDDIYAVATSLSAGFFQNIRGTRRQGGELDVSYRDDRLTAYASYAHVDAVFDADLTIPSPSHPLQDANGDIHVRRGDQLPGIPRDRLKAGAEYTLRKGLQVGGDLQLLSSQFYRGDEANLLAPLPGYAVVGLHASYDVTPRLQLFAKVENVLNARYATFGVLGDPTGVGAPGIPADAVTNGPGVDNRFQSPAAPVAAYGGVKLSF
jgi:outer membrane receptor protein involved in Fe transport